MMTLGIIESKGYLQNPEIGLQYGFLQYVIIILLLRNNIVIIYWCVAYIHQTYCVNVL